MFLLTVSLDNGVTVADLHYQTYTSKLTLKANIIVPERPPSDLFVKKVLVEKVLAKEVRVKKVLVKKVLVKEVLVKKAPVKKVLVQKVLVKKVLVEKVLVKKVRVLPGALAPLRSSATNDRQCSLVDSAFY